MRPLNQRIASSLSRRDRTLAGCLIPLAVLAAVIWISFAARVAHDKPAEPPRVKLSEAKPAKKLELYRAVRDMTVARTEAALQQSPLTHPANFIRVPKGTIVGLTWVGGGFSGRIWYELTAISNGQPVKLYVYRDSMDGWGKAN